MNPAKALGVVVFAGAVWAVILWLICFRLTDLGAFVWLIFTLVGGVFIALCGPDILPRSWRRRLFAWLSHD